MGGHWKAFCVGVCLVGSSPLLAAGITTGNILRPELLLCQAPEKVPEQSEPADEEAKPAAETPEKKSEPAADKPAEKPAEKKPADQKPASPKKPNPIGTLLKGMFAPTPVQRPMRENQNARQKTTRDRSDPRAPFDPEQAKIFRDTQSRIDEKDWPQAVRGIERLLNQSGDSTIRLRGRWTPLKAEARGMLRQLPADVLQNWRQERTTAGQQALANALRMGRPHDLAQVAELYFHTPAGFEAADRLAALHFDRGEYVLATRWYGELLAADAPQSRATGWKLRLAFAAREAGDRELADRMLEGLASATVSVAGKPMNARKWWDETPPVKLALGTDLAEWPQWYGQPRRTGRGVGGDLLLLPRWKQPLTESAPLQTQLEDLLEDLDDQGSTLLPATFPLMVDGKLVFRTLQGVRVVDAHTGRRLWETPDEVSAERLLMASDEEGGQPVQFGAFGQVVVGFRNGIPRYAGGGAEQHPLAQLLFRNANYGVLSSDGRRLFVLEDQAILSSRQPGQFIDPDASDTDAYGRSWSSNKLTAYDLNSGRSLWEIGGASQNDPFELPLAGCFFFGPPTADQGELYLVGEKENEIRLYVLDAATGGLKWSQLLAFSEAKIDVDVVRQCWAAPVSVGGGILICPTTVGWMVAIDRSSHDIVWAQRVAPEKNRDRNAFGDEYVQITQFGESWAQAPPIVAGQRVVYTPQEDGHLYCFNLSDGKKLWQKSREGLYLACVAENRVVVVAANRVVAYSLDDGSTEWSIPLGTLENRPSGRGVQVGHLYHLPLSSGELWTIDLSTGKIASKAFPASSRGRHELGNLAVYQGLLLSLGPLGATTYEQREAVEREIQTALAKDPADPAGNIRKAEYELLRRNAPAALAALHAVREAGLEPALAEQRRVLLIDCIQQIARADLNAHEAEFVELARLLRTEGERREYRRLSAERALARHDVPQAYENYLLLAPANLDDLVMMREGRNSVRIDAWLAGKLEDLWRNAPASAKKELDTRIAEAASAATAAADKQRFVALFGFHPAAVPLHLELAEAAGKAGEFLVAENILENLRGDSQTAPAALERLAKLMSAARLPADAAQCYRLLEDRYPQAKLSNGQTAEDFVLDLRDAGEFPDVPEGAVLDWQNAELSLTRSGVNFSPTFSHDIPLQGGGWPFFRDHRMRVFPQEQRFVTLEANHESPQWSQPLRSGTDANDDALVAADVSGHQVMLSYRGVIHCLSPVERKVLWTHTLTDRPSLVQVQRQPPQPMQSLAQASLFDHWARDAAHMGSGLCYADSSSVVCWARRRVTVLDASTGEVRWVREDVPQGTMVQGGGPVLYLVAPDRSHATLVRALDGREIASPLLLDWLQKSAMMYEGDLIMKTAPRLSDATPVRSGHTALRRFDPVRDREVWRIEIPSGTQMTQVAPDRVALLDPAGKFELLHLFDGRRDALGTLPKSELKGRSESYAYLDYENLYLIVNQQRSRGGLFAHYSDGLTAIPVQGTLHAFDLFRNRERWKHDVKQHSLILEQLDHSPVLLLSNRRFERRGPTNVQTTALLVLDKSSGRKLLDTEGPTQGFHSISVNTADNFIELRSYNERVRIGPKN